MSPREGILAQIPDLSSRSSVPGERESGLVRQFCVFYVHVLEFAGFKDFAAFLAFDEFGVFFTRHNLNARVFAG